MSLSHAQNFKRWIAKVEEKIRPPRSATDSQAGIRHSCSAAVRTTGVLACGVGRMQIEMPHELRSFRCAPGGLLRLVIYRDLAAKHTGCLTSSSGLVHIRF